MTYRVTAADVDALADTVSAHFPGVTIRANRAYGGTAVHVVIPGSTGTSELMTRGTTRDAHTFLSGMLSALDMPRKLARWREMARHSTEVTPVSGGPAHRSECRDCGTVLRVHDDKRDALIHAELHAANPARYPAGGAS